MVSPVLFSNIHSQRFRLKHTHTHTHTAAFINSYIAMSILFFLFNNYVTKCVVFHAILINDVPLEIITQSRTDCVILRI